MSGVIRALRDMVPIRPLTVVETIGITERQATRLLSLSGVDRPPVPETIITQLPRVEVSRMIPSPVTGATQWSRGRWLIVIDGSDVEGRQRFSLAHEFKHILDNPFIDLLYPDSGALDRDEWAEHVCDYFAACLLMPRAWIKRDWGDGIRDLARLRRRYGVSRQAMRVRLEELGLIDRSRRCGTVITQRKEKNVNGTDQSQYERAHSRAAA